MDVVFDGFDLGPGDDVAKFMEKCVVAADYVLMICTEAYVRKADDGRGGAGYEVMIVTGELSLHLLICWRCARGCGIVSPGLDLRRRLYDRESATVISCRRWCCGRRNLAEGVHQRFGYWIDCRGISCHVLPSRPLWPRCNHPENRGRSGESRAWPHLALGQRI